jgi:hypothetical protein
VLVIVIVIVIVRNGIGWFHVYSEKPVKCRWEVEGEITFVSGCGEVERRAMWSWSVLCN